MSVTDDIKARLDIVSYINQYVPLKKAGKYHKACCPFHAEKTPSFTVSEDRQSWRCFGACAEGGDIFNFAMKYHGWDFREALGELAQLAGIELQERSPEQKQRAEQADRLRGMLKIAADAYHDMLLAADDDESAAALAYAQQKRGLSMETIRAFGMGYAPAGYQNLLKYLTDFGYSEDDVIAGGLALRSEKTNRAYDRFRNRLLVPIRDKRGQVVGFGGRVLNPDDKPKYLNSPQSAVFDKSHILFGLDLAASSIRDSETAVIVEGYMDAITAYQAGFTNVVAQMGTALTETQLRLIAPRWAKHIVLALDSDAAGQSATRRSLEVAREALQADFTGKMQVDIRVLQIPDAKDPDDLIRENPQQWAELVRTATPVADYVIDTELADLPSDASIQDKEAVARRMMPLLLATENSLYGRENVQKLAMRLLLPERELLRIAAEAAEAERKRPRRIQPPELDEAGEDGPPPRTDLETADPEEPPPRQFDGEGARPAPADTPAPVQRPSYLSQDVKTEAHMLHMLCRYPEAYYRINGKMREIAAGDARFSEWSLMPLGVEDFSRSGFRLIMGVFLAALRQDEQDVGEFVTANTPPALEEELALIAVDRTRERLDNPRVVAQRDLKQIVAQVQRVGGLIDTQQDVVAMGLRLRLKRLNRERDELRLMQMSASQQGEFDEMARYTEQLTLLSQATDRLSLAEKQVSRLY